MSSSTSDSIINKESLSPSDALMELMAPDGYYSYLGIDKPSDHTATLSKESTIDADAVRKNYRKLSLKHHPDKPGGDVDTFRLLNRAQKVLLNPKLRQQYDILGIDLHDEEQQENDNIEEQQNETTAAEGIIQEIAGMAMTGVMQVLVRTGTCRRSCCVV